MENVHTLPELPYAMNALEPHISKETLEYHYDKHHATYVNNLNLLVQNSEFETLSLEELIHKATGKVFNNAAQVWNHSFYWQCMSPYRASPKGELLDAIKQKFGSIESFEKEFVTEATGHFGSGWTWLVLDENGELAITTTHDADTPLRHNQTPLLTCDVWEHAYYIDYRNSRPDYLEHFWKVVNWDFVAEQFKRGEERKAA